MRYEERERRNLKGKCNVLILSDNKTEKERRYEELF